MPVNRISNAGHRPTFESPQLSVLVFRERAGNDEVWVAQCLEHDICVQATSIEKLQARIERAVVSNCILGLELDGRPNLDRLAPAPSKFFRAFKDGQRFGEQFAVGLSPDNIPSSFEIGPGDYPRAEARSRIVDREMLEDCVAA